MNQYTNYYTLRWKVTKAMKVTKYCENIEKEGISSELENQEGIQVQSVTLELFFQGC